MIFNCVLKDIKWCGLEGDHKASNDALGFIYDPLMDAYQGKLKAKKEKRKKESKRRLYLRS